MVQVLPEITLVVEQADRDERHAQVAGGLDMVARQHAQAARVDGHRLVDAELGREIRDGLRPQHAHVRRAPGLGAGQVLLEQPVGMVDAAVEHQLGGPHV
jgi:hypothetical protein